MHKKCSSVVFYYYSICFLFGNLGTTQALQVYTGEKQMLLELWTIVLDFNKEQPPRLFSAD